MAGRVFDKATKSSLARVTVRAKLVTANEIFVSRETDSAGSFAIPQVPAGIYAVTLAHEGTEYPIEGRFDVRAGMDFVFESCFELDRARGTGAIRPDCSSGFYAESQVVSLGSHRYFRTEPRNASFYGAPPATQALDIGHNGRECIARDRYTQLSADISPSADVQFSRIFFRAAQHPEFYYVDMPGTGDDFTGVLPKPSPETTEIVYYVEATSRAFDAKQTIQYTPRVVSGDEDDCDDYPGAYFTGSDPGIVVGSFVEGASSVPPGFLAEGISTFIAASGSVVGAAEATGGGSFLTSTTGLILIVSAAGAVTVGIVATREKEASPIN